MAKAKAKSKRPQRGADGLYHVQVYIGLYPNGKRFYRRFAGKDWKMLQIEIKDYKMQYEAGLIGYEETCIQSNDPHGERAPEMTLLDAIDKYIETCRVMQHQDPDAYSVGTIAGYASVRKSIEKCEHFQVCANKPIRLLTVADLQDALNKASLPNKDGKSLSAKTIRNWYGLIKPAVETYGPEIRMNRIKIAKRPSKKTMVFKSSMIPEVLRIARSIDDEFFLYVLFTAVLGTRPSESYALTWGDISAEPITSIADGVVQKYGTIYIDKAAVRDEFGKYRLKGTKTESGTRSLSRHWSFFEMLYEVKPRGKANERIFSMNPNSIPYRWKKLRDQADLPEGMVLYDLRHYHATAMAASGADARYIADDMGHADISITQKHYIETLEEKTQAINSAMFKHTEDMIKAYRVV
jgi:integrase